MKYVLDEKDRMRPWYRGMSNMTDDEMDHWFREQLKLLGILIAMVLGMIGLYTVLTLTSSHMEDYEKELFLTGTICLMTGVMIAELSVIPSMLRKMRLVREERGESQ